jgi:flagellar hook-associated protein 1 FlgK
LEIFQYGVNSAVSADVRLIAAAANDATAPANFAGQGDGRNALLMAQLKDKVITAFPATPLNMTFEDYLENRVSNMASNTALYENRTQTGAEIMVQVDSRRLETSGVNMDQELSDMIRFQRGFEASAKMLKTYDETIQMILNIL